jgi:hypothetical protein
VSGNVFAHQTLASSTAQATLFNTYTTAKSVINASDVFTLPANYVRVGSMFHLRAWGALSNIVTPAGTITFQVELGGTVAAWSSGSLQLSSTANTLTPFELDILLAVKTIGSGTAATLIGGGRITALNLEIAAAVNPTVTDTTLMVPAGTPAAGTGWDSTLKQTWDLWVGFSTSNAGNGVQIANYLVDQVQA